MSKSLVWHAGIQVIPLLEKESAYRHVDACIELIRQSGLRNQTTPFETLVEGDWEALQTLVNRIQQHLVSHCTSEVLLLARYHINPRGDSIWDEKLKAH